MSFHRCRVAAHAALRAVGQPIGVGGAGQGVLLRAFCPTDALPGVGICIGRCPAVILVALRSFGLAAQLALRRVLVAVICVFPVMLKALLKGRATLAGGLLHFSGRRSHRAGRVSNRQLAGAVALEVEVQHSVILNGERIADGQRCPVAQNQIDLAGNIERGDREILFYYIPARCRDVIGMLRDLRAVGLRGQLPILVDVRILVRRARRHCGVARNTLAVLAVCTLRAVILIAVAAVQQVPRCADGVPDAASVRYIGGIAAAGKPHRAARDLQSVGAFAMDRAAADGQRTAAPLTANVYAPISDERSAQNIRRAAAVQKYRAVLVRNRGRAGKAAFIVRCDLDRNAALHRQRAIGAYMDRLTAVGLHDLTAAYAILNGQAAAVFDVKYSVQRDKAALPTGRLDRAAVQVQSNIAAFQTDAVAMTVSVLGDRHILQQLHRGARRLLRGGKRRHNVGVLRGGAVADGDLRHVLRRPLRQRRRGQQRQAQGQRHETTQDTLLHRVPPSFSSPSELISHGQRTSVRGRPRTVFQF